VLRRVRCFGAHLVCLDVRQESARHTEALAGTTRALGLGDYAAWDEAQRLEFLARELGNLRPLLPRRWAPSAAVAEVLETCGVIAPPEPGVISAYVISMSSRASDVLAVALLLETCGCASGWRAISGWSCRSRTMTA
jgi:phosphoenolpyruvate carboxylase